MAFYYNFAVVKKGEDCISLVESVSHEIDSGHESSTLLKKLEHLRKEGQELAKQAGERAEEMERVEQQHKEKVEEIQRKIGKVLHNEQQTREDMLKMSSSAMLTSSDLFAPVALMLYNDLQDLERQRMQYNSKAEEMKEVVAFLRKASQFWKEFQDISEDGSNRTAVIKNIISKAKENQKYLRCLQSPTTKKKAITFFEAWKLIETKCAEGSQFKFKTITY